MMVKVKCLPFAKIKISKYSFWTDQAPNNSSKSVSVAKSGKIEAKYNLQMEKIVIALRVT